MNKKNKVLLFDPNSKLLSRLEQVLEDEGFDITSTTSAPESLQLATTGFFDALVIGLSVSEGDAASMVQCVHNRGLTCVVHILKSWETQQPGYTHLTDRLTKLINWGKSARKEIWVCPDRHCAHEDSKELLPWPSFNA